MTGKELVELYREFYDNAPKESHNGMSCSKYYWCDPIFCIYQVFFEKDILSMTNKEVDDLYRLADAIIDMLM